MEKKFPLCLATNNAHKVEEITAVVGQYFTFETLAQIGCYEELPETGKTLEANSLQKAMFVYSGYGVNCLADDSGLEVEALEGLPGVDSAHFSGSRDHQQNIQKVLDLMKGHTNRRARFRTVLTLVVEGQVHVFEGCVEGEILLEPQGDKGFGYDPIFRPLGERCSFALMQSEEKNAISHRARALQQLLAFCRES